MAHPRGQSEQENLNRGFIDPAESLGVVIKGFDGSNYPSLSVDADGKLNVNAAAPVGGATEASLVKLNGFSLPVFDAAVPTFNSASDVWAFKTGGDSGTTVATITITYTDSTKDILQSVVRT